ncbi:MAG: hypothetical protein K9J12_16670 [Melioribacteraceae bacterium]|nr:hypothetical protein [Melioribacteraceae bacterium]MCF8263581.1 hypothetical protein [Melioribacteraceae bacterium]MCF8412426.1 hypothetical protein [Melioribacteraceae bacterium]MCF8430821.1 hypothetical protein [Melioribacteraceae bacterium]
MQYYPTIVTLHILFAGMWLILLPIGMISKKALGTTDSAERIILIKNYLKLGSVISHIGVGGIILTGVALVLMNSGYQFFQFSANHWLVSKQIIILAILALLVSSLIPAAKAIKSKIGSGEKFDSQLKKYFKIETTINVLVILNFLFAVTHRYFG